MRVYKLFKDNQLIGVISCESNIIEDVAEKLGADSISIPHLRGKELEELIDGYYQMRASKYERNSSRSQQV